nr:hypothetical protein Iba_chr04bCG10870 [Ipomoea batatas]
MMNWVKGDLKADDLCISLPRRIKTSKKLQQNRGQRTKQCHKLLKLSLDCISLHGWNPIPSNAVTTAPLLKADPKNGNDHGQESARSSMGLEITCPKIIWDLAYLVKSGMFSAKVAQEPMLAVREGKKSDQNCEVERVEGVKD